MKIKRLIKKIDHLSTLNNKSVIGIDGRCCSGKTTLAQTLKSLFNFAVIQMDDFFLPKYIQQKKSPLEIAGNIDKKRFIKEVIYPLKRDEPINYQKYDCSLNIIIENVQIMPTKITIIEGVYALHPIFSSVYDLTIFMDVDEDEQRERLMKREYKTSIEPFFKKWIPREERYFKTLFPHLRCDYHINTSAREGWTLCNVTN